METNNVIEGREIKSNKKQIKSFCKPIKSDMDWSKSDWEDVWFALRECSRKMEQAMFNCTDDERAKRFAQDCVDGIETWLKNCKRKGGFAVETLDLNSSKKPIKSAASQDINEEDVIRIEDSTGKIIKSSRKLVKSSIEDACDDIADVVEYYCGLHENGVKLNQKQLMDLKDAVDRLWTLDAYPQIYLWGRQILRQYGMINNSYKPIKSSLDTVKVTYDDGTTMITDFNADVSREEIADYYYGNTFNIGSYPKEELHKVVKVEFPNSKGFFENYIKSARYIIEDEWGEVIAEADTYEEAQSVGGARIFDTVKSSVISSSSEVGSIHDRYVLGDITENMALQELKKLVGLKKAKTIIDKWQQTYVLSTRINSSIDKAVREAEDYFGTEASDRTVSCQDILTTKDNEEMYDIAERNNVEVKIGRYSVTFYDKEDVGLED